MSKQIKFLVFQILPLLVICFLTFTNSFANDNQMYSIVVDNLSNKLKSDLSNNDIAVKLNNLETYNLSKNQIGITGTAVCIINNDKSEMPLRFDAKINKAKHTVSDIVYDFVVSESSYFPSSNEEIIMQELMNQISKDYNTKNIVIAIDGFEDISKLTNNKEFTGVGEVRIGDLVWSKVKFDLVIDTETNKAKKIIYKVE